MKNDKLKNIGYKIQLARLNKKLTQEQLAEKCNVSPKYISAIETGKSVGSIPLVIDICNILDITADYIFDTSINNSNNSIEVLPLETQLTYLKLKDENKSFVNQTINHLYTMQKKR